MYDMRARGRRRARITEAPQKPSGAFFSPWTHIHRPVRQLGTSVLSNSCSLMGERDVAAHAQKPRAHHGVPQLSGTSTRAGVSPRPCTFRRSYPLHIS